MFDIEKTVSTPEKRRRREWLAAAAKAVLSCALMVTITSPVTAIEQASATELSDAQKELRAVNDDIDAALDEYNAAQDKIAAIEEEISSLDSQIEEKEAELTPYREQLAMIAKWQYTTGNEGLIGMLLDPDTSLEQFIEQSNQIEKIEENKAQAMEAIQAIEADIENAKQEQESMKREAEEAAEAAQAIAEEHRVEAAALEEKISELREEQREYLLGKGLSGGGPALDIPEDGDVVDYALSRVGCPYVWGASGPTSFDCSGLVMWAYQQAYGISLPHNSEAMRACAKQVISLSEAQPGDVLYRSGHVGLCTKVGAAEYVHAPNSGSYVRINDNNSYSQFTCALRFR